MPTLGQRYLDRLPLAPDSRKALLAHGANGTVSNPRLAMTSLHRALSDRSIEQINPADASLLRRLELALGLPRAQLNKLVVKDDRAHVRLATMPEIKRTPMAPKNWPPRLVLWPFNAIGTRLRRLGRRNDVRNDANHEGGMPDWHKASARRRLLLTTLVLVQSLLATASVSTVLPSQGGQPLELGMLALFAVLFAWISAGFWTAVSGFALLLSGRNRFAISHTALENRPIDAQARTAIILPVCNEDVARPFSALHAMIESLRRTGQDAHFDFFVLSDSNDPDIRVAERQAWAQTCRDINGFGRVFYRWRRHRTKRKSGNVADFCRRWGRNYRYMVVLDADSVMTGACLVKLVRMMEANPKAGLIQTAPNSSGRDTLFGRIQQFANRTYGPLFTAGMHYWQLGESHYWGHNAIIRVAPFMEHCALGRLPGRGTLSGEILSHDFVEAALMRRAGWGVWLAYDLPGSYEEMPPNMIDELKRDRRWCHGNLINARLFFAEGMHAAHRAVFATGVMAYLSSLLWFLFLTCSTALLALQTFAPAHAVTSTLSWPTLQLGGGLPIFFAIAALLLTPKILSVALIIIQGANAYGGALRLIASVLLEILFSALLAPIRMLFHTQFIFRAVSGLRAQWKSPPRDDAQTDWKDAMRFHGWHTVLGAAWAVFVYCLNPAVLWWLLPVVGSMMLSIPLSVISSRVTLGKRSRSAQLFLIPEETATPPELRWTHIGVKHAAAPAGFIDAVTDPVVNALVCATSTPRLDLSPTTRSARLHAVQNALRGGPDNISVQRKMTLLNDPLALSQLHFLVWTSRGAHPGWLKHRRSALTLNRPKPPRRTRELGKLLTFREREHAAHDGAVIQVELDKIRLPQRDE